ncbi:MAG: MarR family transcriptional regulator [Thermoleophilia bacterium]|nr:MarR family transcriptional regulator [Thermoleophilia bacterium]
MNESQDSGLSQHAPGTEYVHLLREIILTYRQLLRELTLETGLSGAQLELLRELALADGRSSVSMLARRLNVDPAAISRLVAALEKDGLVARARDERDRRRQPVVLTEEGRRLAVAFHTQAHEREVALASQLDPRSLKTTIEVLRTVRDTLRRSSVGASTGRMSPELTAPHDD